MRVSLANSNRSFSGIAGRPILEAALQAGLQLAHSCQGGNCGACRARLLDGRISYPGGQPLGLSASEVAEGYILLCRAHASADLVIETFEVLASDKAVIKHLPARIERLQLLAHDVMGVHLRLPAAEPFVFQAGQYIDVQLSGARRRSFSIASPPGVQLLELHVRRVAGGDFSERVFNRARQGDLLNIEGPLGRFVYASGSAPLLMIGGGTGIAPLLSMLRHAKSSDAARRINIYWGVRGQRDLYVHAALLDLERSMRGLIYTPVLSEPDADWDGARGLVHDLALDSVSAVSSANILAAGPPAMIEAVRAGLLRCNVSSECLACDVFDYAIDPPRR